MAMTTRCCSDLSIAAILAISTSHLSRKDIPLLSLESLSAQNERTGFRLNFSYVYVVGRHRRCHVVMDLTDRLTWLQSLKRHIDVRLAPSAPYA